MFINRLHFKAFSLVLVEYYCLLVIKNSAFVYCRQQSFVLYTPSLALKRKTLGDTHPVASLLCVLFFFFFIFTVFQNIAMLFSRQAIELWGFTASHDVSRLCNVVDVNH